MNARPSDEPSLEPVMLGLSDAELLRTLPRHRHGLTREQVRASQAGRIIAATAETIAAEGYAKTTVGAIAERAGVSRKTFYELFEDKEDALLAGYAGVEHLLGAIDATALRAHETATERELIAAGIRSSLRTLAHAPAFTQTFFIEALGAGPRVRRRRDAAIEQVTTAITSSLSAAQTTERALRPPVDRELVRGFLGASIEAIIRHLVHDGPETLEHLEPTLSRLAERILLGLESSDE